MVKNILNDMNAAKKIFQITIKMKNTPKILIALNFIAIIATQSCLNTSSKLDKFMGEWKSTDTTKKDDVFIKNQDDAILLIAGKDTVVARYDKKSDALKLLGSGVITYNEKNGHLLVNNGKDGEAIRIK